MRKKETAVSLSLLLSQPREEGESLYGPYVYIRHLVCRGRAFWGRKKVFIPGSRGGQVKEYPTFRIQKGEGERNDAR